MLPAPTPRLTFRAWREEDAALARRLWGDPDVMRLVGGPLDEAGVSRRLRAEIDGAAGGSSYWPIFAADGSFVGCAGLRVRDASTRVYELGFHLVPSHWGQGLAAEAADAVVAHAFGALGACALFAGHHPENEASRRVLQKLGFRYTHDERYEPTGLLHPSYLLHPSSWLTPGARGER